MLSRRSFLTTSAAGLTGALLSPHRGNAADVASYDANVPVRVITHGPTHHWFGYYDKWQFDATDRYVLSNGVDFEHRSPTAEDRIEVGYVDLQKDDRWATIGHSRAWGWQQGCMLQWVPRHATAAIWNDREGDHYVSRWHDIKTGETRTLSRPIYALSPTGTTAISTDFRRLNEVRPGYGYTGIDDPNRDNLRPDDVGIWSVDLKSGKSELMLSVKQVATFGTQTPSMKTGKHYFNHLLFNPDGSRFVFLHRWLLADKPHRWQTRMLTANPDGSDLYELNPPGVTSHFIWRDPEHICGWSQNPGQTPGFYLFKDQTRETTPVGSDVMTRDGHVTYLPTGELGEWILNDTYPDKQRMQTVYLYHVPTGKRIDLGRFPAPEAYRGEWRCDTHPRSSRDGQWICIDAPHGKEGRQLHLLDLRGIL